MSAQEGSEKLFGAMSQTQPSAAGRWRIAKTRGATGSTEEVFDAQLPAVAISSIEDWSLALEAERPRPRRRGRRRAPEEAGRLLSGQWPEDIGDKSIVEVADRRPPGHNRAQQSR